MQVKNAQREAKLGGGLPNVKESMKVIKDIAEDEREYLSDSDEHDSEVEYLDIKKIGGIEVEMEDNASCQDDNSDNFQKVPVKAPIEEAASERVSLF